jgi:hypothetical protein
LCVADEGPLSFAIKEVGSVDAFREKLRAEGLKDVRLRCRPQLAAPPKEPLTLEL